jgi:hypothetical protein
VTNTRPMHCGDCRFVQDTGDGLLYCHREVGPHHDEPGSPDMVSKANWCGEFRPNYKLQLKTTFNQKLAFLGFAGFVLVMAVLAYAMAHTR